ncbi:MAG: RluA family pseudouridine synthase [Proteobacteria bacterium]|nr:MAG: RluA family pseudouridine synthase [Pseudomonadota bacterium]
MADDGARDRQLVVEAADAGRRLDAWLAQRLGVGRAAVRRLLETGAVREAGRALGRNEKSAPLVAGRTLEVAAFAPPDARRAIAQPELPLSVCAEGPGWIALDKPAGTPVHPLREDETGTLLNALVARRPELHGVGEGGLRSGVVHRLDVDTSGVMLFATDEPTWQRLRAAFRAHRVEKLYRALVSGRVEGEREVRASLVVARHRPAYVRAVDEGTPGARRTSLRLRALAQGRDATLVEVRPRTGFLHQIRATLASLGHPLCGDRTYGPPAERDPSGAHRHLLHAARVAVDEIEAESPDAPDFAEAVKRLVG